MSGEFSTSAEIVMIRPGYDSAGYRGDFYVVGQSDTTFGLFFVQVFANQDTFAYRLDYFKRLCFDLFFFIHFAQLSAK